MLKILLVPSPARKLEAGKGLARLAQAEQPLDRGSAISRLGADLDVQLFATPWIAVCQASLLFTVSQSLLKLMSIESIMPFNHHILCDSLLLPPSIFPSIRVFPNESALHIRWPEYRSFSFSLSLLMNIQD